MSATSSSSFNFRSYIQGWDAGTQSTPSYSAPINFGEYLPSGHEHQLCVTLTLLDLKRDLCGGSYGLVARANLEGVMTLLGGGNTQVFLARLAYTDNRILHRVSLAHLCRLGDDQRKIRKSRVWFALNADETLCATKLGNLGADKFCWSLAAQRLNIMDERNPIGFPQSLLPRQFNVSRCIDISAGKFVAVTPSLLEEINSRFDVNPQLITFDTVTTLLENPSFQQLQSAVNQTNVARFYLAVDLETDFRTESDVYFNERILEFTLGEIRCLRSDEFTEIALRMPEICGFASRRQLQGLNFAQFTPDQMEALVRGDMTTEAYSERLRCLSREQRIQYRERCTPQQLSDVPPDVWVYWNNRF